MQSIAYPERLSGFIHRKLSDLRSQYGENSQTYIALARQYLIDPLECEQHQETNEKHYEAGVHASPVGGELPQGVERLYRRVLVIEPTLTCLAHCRYCLRSNYPKHTMTEKELVDVAMYCGSSLNEADLNEVLITGGDPLIIPRRIEVLLQALMEYAPNIRFVRIGTRIFTQDPERLDDDVLRLFRGKPSLRFEVATQVNHPVELFPEAEAAFRSVTSLGVTVYAQNVILKGVNDDLAILVDLYNQMRANRIESHYLFHCVPLRRTHHLRTSIDRGVRLAAALTSCGLLSGRAKPMFAAMTDVGKITFYEGTIAQRDDKWVQLRSSYKLEDRRRWNPSWRLPTTALVDDDGYLRVWYLDGED